MCGDDVHEGAADDYTVRDLGDGLDVGGGGDTEADADREGSMLTDLGDRGGEVGGQLGALAGDAFARDVVDEARGVLRDEADARGRRGRSHDEDVGEAVLLRGGDQFVGFFGRAVEDEQAVGAGFADLGAVVVEAEGEQQVVIADVRLRLRLRLSPRILVKRALENLTTALGTLLEGCYGASRTTASVHQSSSAPNWSLRLLKYCTDIRARSYIYIYTHRSLHSTYIVA